MKIFFQIVTSFVLAYWPILMMTSVMIFDAPGSTDHRPAIITALAVAFLPVFFGLLYFLFDQTFWGIRPKTFLFITIGVSILASLLFGYPKLLSNSLKGVSSNGYFVKGDQVYYEGDLTTAKPTGFEVIDLEHARDAQAVYYRGRVIEGAKAGTFAMVSPPSSYFTDGQNIFFNGKILAGSDAASFTQLLRDGEASVYFKDKNAVYAFGRKIEGLIPDSAKILNGGYMIDAEHVFYLDKPMGGVDVATFAVLPEHEGWAKDKNKVYLGPTGYSDIDAATLEILDRGYAKDKSKVYYTNNGQLSVVEGANPAAFKVTRWDSQTESEATDGRLYFVNGKVKKK